MTKDSRIAALSTMLAMKEEPEINEEDPFKEVGADDLGSRSKRCDAIA